MRGRDTDERPASARDRATGRVRTRRAVAALVATMALASCGDAPDPPVGAALRQALAAFADRDAAGVCRLLSRKARFLIGHSGHEGPPLHCESDVERYFQWMEGYRTASRPRVLDVASDGDGTATADVRLPGGKQVTLPFRQERGRWRLDALFDAPLSYMQVARTPRGDRLVAQSGNPPERVDAGAVTVREADEPDLPHCPPTDTERFPRVRGGCVLKLKAEKLAVSVWTPFGVVRFGRCDVEANLRMDGDGHVWIPKFKIVGPNPCSDSVPCRDDKPELLPWQGTIERDDDGRLRLRIHDVCLDSCIGRFEGTWDLRLTEGPERWSMRLASMIGTSGWRIDGTIHSRGLPVTIE